MKFILKRNDSYLKKQLGDIKTLFIIKHIQCGFAESFK